MVDYRVSIQKNNHVAFKYKEDHTFLVESLTLFFPQKEIKSGVCIDFNLYLT